jgi:hypothetical protein
MELDSHRAGEMAGQVSEPVKRANVMELDSHRAGEMAVQ